MTAAGNTECWIEPGTSRAYPMAYGPYRREREAQEKWPSRHRSLHLEIDRYVWRCWRRPVASEVDVVLTFRDGVSPRVQRIVGAVLRDIGRGSPPAAAISHVARRFGLRQGQARAFITAAVGFELRERDSSD
jgi:hypothetical protein